MESKEMNLFLSNLQDHLRKAQNNHEPSYTRFLDPLQQRKAAELCNKNRNVIVWWLGGYENAERRIAAIAPDYYSLEDLEVPIAILRISWNTGYYSISHRDILGALIGLGIIRENIGDIIIEEGFAYIFVLQEISGYILLNLSTVGKAKVKIESIDIDSLQMSEPKIKEIRATVSSMRLDSIVSAGYQISRSKTVPLISSGAVKLNWEEVLKMDAPVREGDMISVKGKGRIKVDEIGGQTRKGRISITLLKYL